MRRTAYKYKKWDKYAKRIITHQELYFASPKKFNDLFDCQTYGIIKNYNPPCPPFGFTKEGKLKFYNVDPIAFLNETTKRNIDDLCGVCCFSKSYDSILMWSHYADYNRGVCFRFDLDKINLANGLLDDVTYVKKQPIFDYSDPYTNKSERFFCKYRVWKYEREVRGLIFLPHVDNESSRKVIFPKEALKEIIFGANYTDMRTFDEVINLCHKHGFDKVKFSFMKATTNSDSYKLLKVPLNK